MPLDPHSPWNPADPVGEILERSEIFRDRTAEGTMRLISGADRRVTLDLSADERRGPRARKIAAEQPVGLARSSLERAWNGERFLEQKLANGCVSLVPLREFCKCIRRD